MAGGDFRLRPPAHIAAALLVTVALGLVLAASSRRLRREPALVLYAAIPLAGGSRVWLGGGTPG